MSGDWAYYEGDIEGKFQFGNGIHDLEFFGEEISVAGFYKMFCNFDEDDLPKLDKGINDLENEIGEYLATIEQFFKLNEDYKMENLLKIRNQDILVRDYYPHCEEINDTKIDNLYDPKIYKIFTTYLHEMHSPKNHLTHEDIELKLKCFEKLRLGKEIKEWVEEQGSCEVKEYCIRDTARKLSVNSSFDGDLIFDGISRYFDTGDGKCKFMFGFDIETQNKMEENTSYFESSDHLFGVEMELPLLNFGSYFFDKNSVPKVEKGIRKCENELGEILELIESYFDQSVAIDYEKIAKYCNENIDSNIRFNEEHIASKFEWFDRLMFGREILECIKNKNECWFDFDMDS